MKSRFAPDRGLSRRMVVTGFLLGLLYVGFVALLIALTKSAVVAVILAGGLLFVQYWFSDRIALYAMRNGAALASLLQLASHLGQTDGRSLSADCAAKAAAGTGT